MNALLFETQSCSSAVDNQSISKIKSSYSTIVAAAPLVVFVGDLGVVAIKPTITNTISDNSVKKSNFNPSTPMPVRMAPLLNKNF